MTPRTFWDQAGRLWVLDGTADFVHVIWDDQFDEDRFGPFGWYERAVAESEFGPLVATC